MLCFRGWRWRHWSHGLWLCPLSIIQQRYQYKAIVFGDVGMTLSSLQKPRRMKIRGWNQRVACPISFWILFQRKSYLERWTDLLHGLHRLPTQVTTFHGRVSCNLPSITASSTDLNFRKIFLLTYQSFTTPETLLHKLIQRYHAVDILGNEEKKQIHQVKD